MDTKQELTDILYKVGDGGFTINNETEARRYAEKLAYRLEAVITEIVDKRVRAQSRN